MKKILYISVFLFSLFFSFYSVEALECKYNGNIDPIGLVELKINDGQATFCSYKGGHNCKSINGYTDFNGYKINIVSRVLDNGSCPSLVLKKNEGNYYTITDDKTGNYKELKLDTSGRENITSCTKMGVVAKNDNFGPVNMTFNSFSENNEIKYEIIAELNGYTDSLIFTDDTDEGIELSQNGVTKQIFLDPTQTNDIIEKIKSSDCNGIYVNLAGDNKFWQISTFNTNDEKIYIDPTEFTKLLGSVINPLSEIADVNSYTITINNEQVPLSSIEPNDSICSGNNCEEPTYQTEQALRKVKAYCNSLKSNKNVDAEDRLKDCQSFDLFVKNLSKDEVIFNIKSGCGFISKDLGNKLNLVLNIIKIAGPILALLLGMLDFTRVLAVGDADKGLKDAFKKFQTRLIAAALLFLVPAILSLIINGVMPDISNPFCDVI